MNENLGKWLGWIGIILGIVGIFWLPILMGAIAVVAGIIGLTCHQKGISWISIIVGVIVLLIGIF